MKNVIDELKASSVLTKEEIQRIKLYVNRKYPNNSSIENANILSRTIFDVIDKCLVGICEGDKQNIRRNIIQSTILSNRINILKLDVFDAYITELKENPQLKRTLFEWINKNQKNKVSQEVFEEYVISIHSTKGIDKSSYLDIKLQTKKIKFMLEAVSKKISSEKIALCLLSLLILFLYYINNFIVDNNLVIDKFKSNNDIAQVYVSNIDTYDLYVKDEMSNHTHLPDYFNYKTIDKGKLLEFLNSRNSILAEEPYFSAIIRTSKEFNVNPHVLFAITGQEQSFVPKDHKNSKVIANNPFNVYHSWKEYNTDIYDSSKIAARTIINLSKDKPANMDIFNWINSKYAEDKNWGRGVKEIFETLEE